MKSLILSFLSICLLVMNGCRDNSSESITKEGSKEQFVQMHVVERFKLFPTQNLWTFIKLDTQTGQMWQVQFSVSDEYERFESILNSTSLVTDGVNRTGRFELYPTKNFYNFILLDQYDGRTWQVQWSFEEENRVVIPI